MSSQQTTPNLRRSFSRPTTPMPNAIINEATSTNSTSQHPRGLIVPPDSLQCTTQEHNLLNPMDAAAGPHTTPYPKITATAFPSIHNVDGGWTSATRNTVPASAFHAQSPHAVHPLPQYSEHAHHLDPMVPLQNGAHPMGNMPPWLSDHQSRYPDNCFIVSPPPPGGPLYSGGYTMLPPTQSHHGHPNEHTHMPNPLHHDFQRQFHSMPQMDPHMSAPYNKFYPSEYGNYFTAQPMEPFNDHSFAFCPPRPQQPPFPIPSRNTATNGFHYPSQPQYFFPPPQILLTTPPLPQRPVLDMEMENQFRIVNQPSNISSSSTHKSWSSPQGRLKPSSSLRASFPKKLMSNPAPTLKHSPSSSSHSVTETTPTSGNARLGRRANNLSRPTRSALLEEFRNNRDKNWVLEAIFGHVVEFSGDQHGSRFIQQQLEQASDEEKDTVFREIAPHNINNLIRDVFGNYVIQKFFDLGNEQQINILTSAVEEQAEHLSLNIYGCRVVQKALETISPTQQSSIIRRLDSSILHCIKDAHGNHVVQKLVEVVAPEHLTFLLAICDHILELSTHPYGCRVLQRCLEHLPTDYTRPLLDAINRYTEDLMKDQYGNYVIQFILEQGQDCDKAVIFATIRGSLIRLAQHKYASNVCEKALMCADSERREILINEIMTAKSRTSGENPILIMVKDQYANYVLQRALTLSEGQQRVSFFYLVKPLLAGLRKLTLTYSRPLVSMERLMDKYFNQPTTVDSPENAEPTESPLLATAES